MHGNAWWTRRCGTRGAYIGDDPIKYRRWQEMEIKHGRIAMLATLHVIATGAGYKWDAYASYLSFPPVSFKDIPAGTLGSWAALPQAGWAQIVALVAILDNSLFAQAQHPPAPNFFLALLGFYPLDYIAQL